MRQVASRGPRPRQLRRVALLAGVLLAGTGCAAQTHTITVVPGTRPSTAMSPPSTPPATGASATTTASGGTTSQNLSIGGSTTLSGNGGETMKVSVIGVQDPASGGMLDQPDPGTRYVGVELAMANIGGVDYSDAPSNGAALIDSTGQQHDPVITSGGSCDSPGTLNIMPGNWERLCIPFELPEGTAPGLFQFTLSSGFAPQTAQWSLSSATAGAASSMSGSGGAAPASDPASVIRTHLQDINAGNYQAAFALMTSSYRAENPSWPSDRAAADPGIEIISIGTPSYGSGTARVPVDFFARDRHPSPGSDTRCREFQGTAALVEVAGSWRYSPAASQMTATDVPTSDPRCPS